MQVSAGLYGKTGLVCDPESPEMVIGPSLPRQVYRRRRVNEQSLDPVGFVPELRDHTGTSRKVSGPPAMIGEPPRLGRGVHRRAVEHLLGEVARLPGSHTRAAEQESALA